jgi:hypothetical protein
MRSRRPTRQTRWAALSRRSTASVNFASPGDETSRSTTETASTVFIHSTTDAVLPYEVSVTRNPAFADALVLGVGADALATWEILTEAAPVIPGPGAASGWTNVTGGHG